MVLNFKLALTSRSGSHSFHLRRDERTMSTRIYVKSLLLDRQKVDVQVHGNHSSQNVLVHQVLARGETATEPAMAYHTTTVSLARRGLGSPMLSFNILYF